MYETLLSYFNAMDKGRTSEEVIEVLKLEWITNKWSIQLICC